MIPEPASLAAEVDALKARKTDDAALAQERYLENSRRRREAAASMPGVSEAAVVAQEWARAFERMEAASKKLREEIAAQFADLRPRACRVHPLILRPPAFEETLAKTRERGVFTAGYAPCGECRGREQREAYHGFWLRRGVEAKNLDSTLDNFATAGDPAKQAALDAVCRWQAGDGVFLLLHGSPGTGKGHLATGVLKAHGDGLFVKHAAMLRRLRDSYTDHSTTALLAEWQRCPVLALDEFGLSAGGKDEPAMLYDVIAERYDKDRPTILTSNLPIDQLRQHLGYRLLDRIKSALVQVPMFWESHRKGGPR